MLSNKKIGFLIPSPNCTMIPEMYSMGLQGVDYHPTRLRMNQHGGAERLLEMLKYAKDGTELLMTAEVHGIIYGCTSGSFIKGLSFEKEVQMMIKELVGDIPVVTTAGAVLAALQSLKAKKVALGTPYTEDVTQRGRIFLEEAGFQVTKTHSLAPRSSCDKCEIPYRETMEMAHLINTDEADAIVISCTALPTFGIIERLENELGKPVVTANQASIWMMLREMNIYRPLKSMGTLFF